MMAPASEDRVVAVKRAMPDGQVVGEHADVTALKLALRRDLEFDLNAGDRGEDLPQHVQGAMMTTFVEVPVTADENVELEIVVGQLTVLLLEDAAFAAPI